MYWLLVLPAKVESSSKQVVLPYSIAFPKYLTKLDEILLET